MRDSYGVRYQAEMMATEAPGRESRTPERRPPPSVLTLVFFEMFCAALPSIILFLATLATQETFVFERLVRYSVILLIGLAVFLSTLSALMTQRGIGMDLWGTLSIVLLCFFVAGASIGVFADELNDRGIPLPFGAWLGFQIGYTIVGLFYCAVTKSSLLNDERIRQEGLALELASLRQRGQRSNEHTRPDP